MAPPFNVVMRATGEYTTMCVVGESPDTLQTLPQGLSRLALEGWYGFHMVFQERWSFLPRAHSPYPAQSRVAARAGFCDEWEKTPPLLENHEKCIFSHATLCCQNTANNKRSAGNIAWENRSAHPGRTEVIHLLSSIRQQAQAITHPSAGSGCALYSV